MSRKIPQRDGDFDSYITSTTDYLEDETPTNGERLGLTSDELSEWGSRRNNWVTIYGKHKDASKRTSTVTAEKQSQKKSFTKFANPLLTRMSVSPIITSDDRGALNLPERDAATERPQIEDTPYGKLLAMDGGNIKVRVRTTSDGNRASRHPDADHVEMRYALVSSTQPIQDTPLPLGNDNNSELSTKNRIPNSAMECVNTVSSRKAIFIVKLGQENSGKRIFAFFRWVNTSNPEYSGPWGMAVQGIVV